ncbi:nuclear protein localization protein 4 [Chytridiales sp. JEL 0842]|nr:nuclear protein localization protein 4 [Chytridiales sp. JEL 0842]
MLIRIRSPDGQVRVEVPAGVDLATLKAQVSASVKRQANEFQLSLDPTAQNVLQQGPLALKHGDMIYLQWTSAASAPEPSASKIPVHFIKQDPIDDFLEKQTGTVKRGRDPNFCRHGDSGMCDYCMPVEPYDTKYLEQNKIKHMAYHAYLRQACTANKTQPVTSPTFIPPLDEPDLKVKDPCPSKSHAPFPEGICTKCQPSALTLQSQTFRMVDHVEFETSSIMQNFINFWIKSGYQRFGYLFGRYEPYSEVPLGVKAVVSAIYEPPQSNFPDAIQLTLPNPQEAIIDSVAKSLGLQLVGMIYTDLLDDGTGKGKVVCKRHEDSYFLSSAECIFAAQMQAQFPVVSKYSSSQKFGSRFVTCVVSGNLDSEIVVNCYQISNAGVSMVRDNVIEASVEPSLMRVKASTNEQYVPEIFFKYKNKYGLMVKEAAKPTFPVEYLLVTLSHGFPQNPTPLFTSPTPFPIENRGGIESQSMGAVKRHLESAPLVTALSNFHLLLYLKEAHILDEKDYQLAVDVGRYHKESDADRLVCSGGWQTLLMITNEADTSMSTAPSGSGGSGSASGGAKASRDPWQCRHCTYVNISGDTCEVCALPADG